VSYAESKCFCKHTIVAMLTAIAPYAGSKCSCMHSIVAMLTAMSCRTQEVSVLVHIESLPCSPLCRVVRSV
jgi:hypothetical protein